MNLAVFTTPKDLIQAAQAGLIEPMDAVDELVRRGDVVIRDAPLIDDPIARGFDAFKAQLHENLEKRWRKYELLKPNGQQVIFAGPFGRVRVTFVNGQAILGLQKPSGAFKKVDSLPWIFGKGDPHGHAFALNERLQELCGPDFVKVD